MKTYTLVVIAIVAVSGGCRSAPHVQSTRDSHARIFGTDIPEIGPAQAITLARQAIVDGVCRKDGITDNRDITVESVTYVVPHDSGTGGINVDCSINGTRRRQADHEVQRLLSIQLNYGGEYVSHFLGEWRIGATIEPPTLHR
jgi:hypothetical protein